MTLVMLGTFWKVLTRTFSKVLEHGIYTCTPENIVTQFSSHSQSHFHIYSEALPISQLNRLWAQTPNHLRIQGLVASKLLTAGTAGQLAGAAKEKPKMAEVDKVSMDRLDTDNYGTWSVRMKYLLVHKGVWEAVSGSGTVDSGADQKALALIVLSVKDVHLPTLAHCKTSKEAWNALEAVYTAKSNARRLQLKRALNSLRKLPEEALTVYVARAKNIRDQLAAAGHIVKDDEVAWSVLAGLPGEFDILVTMLETSNDVLDLDSLLAKLLAVEQRASTKTADNKAYMLTNRERPATTRSNGKEQRECYYCGKTGHLRKDCLKKRRDDARRGQAHGPRTSFQTRSSVAMTATTAENVDEWVLDSGASRHITNHLDNMLNVRPVTEAVTITFGNGNQAKAEAIGDVELTGLRDSDVEKTTLKDVLFVKGATANLLSIPRAVSKGVKFDFSDNACRVLKDKALIAKAHFHNGVYGIRNRCIPEKAMTAQQTPRLWHRRFGHLGYDNLAKLQQHNMVSGISVAAAEFKTAGAGDCEPCIKAKQHKLSRPSSQSDTSRPLELVHMDVCGPLQARSLGGSAYLATYLDDYSKLSVVQPVANKSDIVTVTKDVINMLENQSGQRLLAARTDNGTEYVNKELSDYFKSKGILHQRTVRYTPEQNGAAERLNRTIMERVRAMLEDSQLPKELWAESAVTASYIRNRSPTVTRLKTPWELFYKRKPDVSNMRTFGARVYALIPKELRRKLDSHAERGRLVGYQPNTKGYRVYLDSGKVTVAADTTFVESEPTAITTSADSKPSKEPSSDETAVIIDQNESSGEEVPAPNAPEQEEAAAPDSAGPAGLAPRYPPRQRQPPGQWWKSPSAMLAAVSEPTTYEEALQSEHAEDWRQAMDDEMKSLLANNTWTLEEPPKTTQPIPVKWVFKIKKDSAGNTTRYKAPLRS